MRSSLSLVLFSFVLVGSGCASGKIAAREAPAARADEAVAKDRDQWTALAEAKEARGEGFGIDKQKVDADGLPVTDEQIAKVLDWHALIPAQARVALLEARSVREWYECGSWGYPQVQVVGSDWSVRPSVAEEVEAMKGELAKSNRVASVSTVPAMFLPVHADLARCRYAAARANSDLVLLYAKATRVVKFHNKLANFYPLVIGLALPGEETSIVSRVEGALVDVRTGRVFAVSQASARASDMSTVFTSSDEARAQLVEQTEREAVLALAKGIKGELDVVAASAATTLSPVTPMPVTPAPVTKE